MSEKMLEISQLFDYYGSLLGEKQRTAIDYYYNDDLSLSEIAELMEMTRQGVRDHIKNSEAFLYECEEKLSLLKKGTELTEISTELSALSEAVLKDENRKEISERLYKLSKKLQEYF